MRFQSSELGTQNQIMERLCREVSAFANSNGGIIHIADNGTGETQNLILQVQESFRVSIRPDVTACVHFFIEDDGSIRIEVQEGMRKPYYLKDKGMRPIGVFVRADDRTVCAGPQQILNMIRATCGDVYEEMRSLNQELTFAQAAIVFARCHVDLSPQRYSELGITDPEDGEFTNLGLMLSDQCAHSIRITVYDSKERRGMRDQKEVSGSVCRQLEEASYYLMAHAGSRAARTPYYPTEAVREALLNALEHRDYAFTGSILINIYDTEIEFISTGGLMADLSPADIRSGVSEARNRRLARVFRRLAVTGSSAVGIRRIFTLYQGEEVHPEIEVTSNSFRFTLPKLTGVISEENRVPDNDPFVAAVPMRALLGGRPQRAMSREDRQTAMIMLEVQQILQRQTAQKMSWSSVETSGRGKLRTYKKR